MMKLRTMKNWHGWIGLVLCLPLVIIAGTAVLLAFADPLGLDKVPVDVSGWPGYQADSATIEAKCCLLTAEGVLLIGGKDGLFRVNGEELAVISQFAGYDVRHLVTLGDGVLMATKQGAWIFRQSRWHRIHNGDVHSASADAGGRLRLVVKGVGILVSDDGGENWSPDSAYPAPAISSPTGKRIPLKALITDLHTGKALLGGSGSWIWNAVNGLALATLALSGLVLWLLPRRARKRARSEAEAAARSCCRVNGDAIRRPALSRD